MAASMLSSLSSRFSLHAPVCKRVLKICGLQSKISLDLIQIYNPIMSRQVGQWAFKDGARDSCGVEAFEVPIWHLKLEVTIRRRLFANIRGPSTFSDLVILFANFGSAASRTRWRIRNTQRSRRNTL